MFWVAGQGPPTLCVAPGSDISGGAGHGPVLFIPSWVLELWLPHFAAIGAELQGEERRAVNQIPQNIF